jgi:hypothetical protein
MLVLDSSRSLAALREVPVRPLRFALTICRGPTVYPFELHMLYDVFHTYNNAFKPNTEPKPGWPKQVISFNFNDSKVRISWETTPSLGV